MKKDLNKNQNAYYEDLVKKMEAQRRNMGKNCSKAFPEIFL
jgi:hypothetical protein